MYRMVRIDDKEAGRQPTASALLLDKKVAMGAVQQNGEA